MEMSSISLFLGHLSIILRQLQRDFSISGNEFFIIKGYITETKVSHEHAVTRNAVVKVAWY